MQEQVQTVSVEETLKRLIEQLDQLNRTKKELTDTLETSLEVYPQYKDLKEQVSEKTKEKNNTKNSLIMGNEDLKELTNKLAGIKEDMKMVKDSLSTYMLQYYRETGNQYVGEGKTKREFSFKVQVVPGQLSMFGEE